MIKVLGVFTVLVSLVASVRENGLRYALRSAALRARWAGRSVRRTVALRARLAGIDLRKRAGFLRAALALTRACVPVWYVRYAPVSFRRGCAFLAAGGAGTVRAL